MFSTLIAFENLAQRATCWFSSGAEEGNLIHVFIDEGGGDVACQWTCLCCSEVYKLFEKNATLKTS